MDYQIQTEFQGPGYVAVPNAVAQAPVLSPEALGVLVYLASLPRGFLARVGVIQERFAMGKDKWQRIARELRAAGAMELHTVRGVGGRAIGKRMVVRWPEVAQPVEGHATESRETRLSDRKPGNPAAGKPAKHCRETRQTLPGNPAPYKEERKKPARASARTPDARPMGGGSGRAPVEGGSRPADPWARAASAANAGLQWLHPETGRWCSPSEFPDGVQSASPALRAGGG